MRNLNGDSMVLKNVRFDASPRRLGNAGCGTPSVGPGLSSVGRAGPELVRQNHAAEAGYHEGHASGRSEGFERGLADAKTHMEVALEQATRDLTDTMRLELDGAEGLRKAEHSARLAAIDSLLDNFEAAVPVRLAALQDDAVVLAFETVCKLIGAHPGRREEVADRVAVALAAVRDKSLLRVRLNPDDLRALNEFAAGTALVRRHRATEWCADSTIPVGACVIETPSGHVEALLDEQLRRVRDVWVANLRVHEEPDSDPLGPGEPAVGARGVLT